MRQTIVLLVLFSTACKNPAPGGGGEEEPTVFEDPNRNNDVDPASALPKAPELAGVSVVVNRDNALVQLPVVAGAKDFRAYRLPAGFKAEIAANGGLSLSGTTVYCAGLRQRNRPAAEPELMQTLQVNDIAVKTTIVVEAIDSLCPFVGVVGHTHADMEVKAPQLVEADKVPFSIFTEKEVRAKYGSLYVNGHAAGSALGGQSEPVAPQVLARAVIEITPLSDQEPPTGSFFDDFTEDAVPEKIADLPAFNRTNGGAMFQTPRWSMYSYGAGYTELSMERGQMHMVLSDYNQNVMATNVAYPRQVAQLSDTGYLHITYEVPSNASARRVWWLSRWGADAAGQTLDAGGALTNAIVQAPFFSSQNGVNPSLAGWNCLQLFPRDGHPFPLMPDMTRPESDVRVMQNTTATPVVNVSPPQYPTGGNVIVAPSWYRQRDGAGNLLAPMLDDQLNVGQRTRFDIYVRRDRVIMFAGGKQRLCNDFPGQKLTMSEAAVGFGQVLFDSADERRERSQQSNDRTGQRYYAQNTPYVDVRSWDNVGFEENVGEPAGFSAAGCYAHSN